MRISPHKKRKRTALPTTTIKVASVGGVKECLAVWPHKRTRSAYDGRVGNKYTKRRRAIQLPGNPSGKCLGAGKEAACRCGKHNV